VIDVEGSCGPNWAEMEPIEITAPKEAA